MTNQPKQPTAEWLASLAKFGPFRISYDALTPQHWYVVDVRPYDAFTVAGPFKTRAAALARADRLNKESRS